MVALGKHRPIVKAPANEETFVEKTKCFSKKSETFYFSEAKIFYATHVSCPGKRGEI